MTDRIARIKYPYIDRYIQSIRDTDMSDEFVENEILLLNKAALFGKRPNQLERRCIIFGIILLGMLLSFPGIFIFILVSGVYFEICDECPQNCRDAERRYIDFVKKIGL